MSSSSTVRFQRCAIPSTLHKNVIILIFRIKQYFRRHPLISGDSTKCPNLGFRHSHFSPVLCFLSEFPWSITFSRKRSMFCVIKGRPYFFFKMSESQTRAGNQKKFEKLKNLKWLKFILGTCWTTFVLMSRLKSQKSKIAMFFFWPTSPSPVTLDLIDDRAGSQLKMSESQTRLGTRNTAHWESTWY